MRAPVEVALLAATSSLRLVRAHLPGPVLKALSTGRTLKADQVTAEVLAGGTGAATAEVIRITGRLDLPDGRLEPFSVISKTVRPLTEGRHAAGAHDPGHWAYWQREPFAYASGILPAGPGMRARCRYAVIGPEVYMEDVCGEPEIPRLAANRLGQWQATAARPDVSWLTTDQLSQRVSVTELDWSAVDADSRAVALWQARWQLLDQLSAVPRVLSHGDFGTGNIIRAGDDTVVFDWGTVGKAAVGSDLAYLGLGTLDDFTADYLASLAGRYPRREAVLGYRATLCLVGTSRLHWMLMAGRGIPPGYLDFIWDNRPLL